MITLTERQKKMLEFILAETRPVPVAELAGLFYVSPRTVRNDQDVLDSFLRESDVTLLRRPGKGCRVAATPAGLAALRERLRQPAARSLSPSERTLCASLLLLLEAPVSYQRIADFCGVNKMTISRDMESLAALLAQNRLTLLRKSGKGAHVEGTETDVRGYFGRLIRQEMEGGSPAYPGKTMDLAAACLRAPPLAPCLAPANALLDGLESSLGVDYQDKTHLGFCLAYALMRAGAGCRVPPEQAPDVGSYAEYPLIQAVLHNHGVEDPGEAAYITGLVLSSKITLRENSVYSSPARDETAEEMARWILDEICQVLDFDLAPEEESAYFQSLYLHVKVAMFRLRHNIVIPVELFEELKLTIPLVYELAKQIVARCEQRFGVLFDPDETVYIALHIAAIYEMKMDIKSSLDILIVCNFGVATSNALKTRLLRLLPTSNIIGPFSAAKGLAYLENAAPPPDLVVSSAPLPPSVPAIQVNPLLHDDDVEKINTALMQKYYEKQCLFFMRAHAKHFEKNSVVTLSSIVPKEHIRVLDGCEGWEAAIHATAAPLLERGFLEKRYVARIIQIINEIGNYMILLPEVAFVHAGTDDGINQNCTSVLALRRPVLFGSKRPQPVRTLVLLGNRDKYDDSMLRIIPVFESPLNRLALQRPDISEDMIYNMHSRGEEDE